MGNGLGRIELQGQDPEEAWKQAVADSEKIK